MNKTTKLITTIMFVLASAVAWALPGTGAANLQTTSGVTTAVVGSELTITAPNRSVLTWQAFGSGTDTIGAADALKYVLPSSTSSVLNIVAGGASTTIDGYINSNGNVFILNPQGILIGGGARLELNKLVLSTSDNPAFANYYFQQNGKLPSQDGLVAPAGAITVNAGSIIALTDNITMVAKNVDIKGTVSQNNISITADGNVNVGTQGLTYIKGGLDITNPTGTTVLGGAGGSIIVTEAITSNGGATSTFNTVAASNIQAKSLTVNGGAVTVDRVNTAIVNAAGTNVTVAAGLNVANPVVNVTGNGTVNVTSPSSLTTTVTNTGVGTTTVNSTGALTLNRVQVEGTAGASFTGASINDTTNRLFVYGPASFTATAGNVTVNRGNHSFGPLSVAATGDAVVVEDATTNLNVVNAAKLTLRSTGSVFSTPTTGVVNSATNSITAAGNITLNGNGAGAYTLTGGNVALASNGAVTLGNVLADGTLSVVTTGAIAQATDTSIRSTGSTTFTGSGLNVNNAGNAFGGLAIDVGVAGAAAVGEDTTLNLTSLRAASATLRSLASVITSGTNPVVADTYTITAGAAFTPAANLRSTNPLTVLAGSSADLSLLSLANNLNNKAPAVVAPSYKAPQP